jgi:hypothetical protein
LNIIEFIEPFIEFTSKFSSEISKLKDHIYERINNLTETEIKEIDQGDIERVTYILKRLYNIGDDNMSTKMIDLTLNYHYKCLVSKIFDKRLKGISNISRIIELSDINTGSG